MKPMKLTDVGPDVTQKYIDDPAWIMQQKMDGARMVSVITQTEDGWDIFYTNNGTGPIAFSAAKLKLPPLTEALKKLLDRFDNLKDLVLDGELIIEDGVYWVFDLLQATDLAGLELSTPQMKLEWRHALLHEMFGEGNELVKLSPTAYSSEQKKAMWAAVQLEGVEGAVSKRLDSIYQPGARSIDWVKHKLVKTADVIVTAATREIDDKGIVRKGSAKIEVYSTQIEDTGPAIEPVRRRVPIGSASLIGKDLSIEVGSVVEIEYLYFTGKGVIQPRITRIRPDKKAEECDLAQFPEYTRKIAWVR